MKATGTELQMHGARYGSGIYLTPTLYVASQFATARYFINDSSSSLQSELWQTKSKTLNLSHSRCIALCEVLQSDKLEKPTSDVWICKDPKHVCTRFFFVYDQNTGSFMEKVDIKRGQYYDQILQACSSTNDDPHAKTG